MPSNSESSSPYCLCTRQRSVKQLLVVMTKFLLTLQAVNLATVAYLLFGSASPHLGMMVQALADGPLAGALLVWQCSWVFGSATHAVRYISLHSRLPYTVLCTSCLSPQTHAQLLGHLLRQSASWLRNAPNRTQCTSNTMHQQHNAPTLQYTIPPSAAL